MFVLPGVFERAIAEAAKRRFSGEPNAEAALRSFWAGYADALVSRCRPKFLWRPLMLLKRINNAGEEIEFHEQTWTEALRVCGKLR